MVKLIGTFSRLSPKKILVIGDLMLDTYTIGKARRISPEAPVAVVHVVSEENRPGGAGNVILNLISMGADVAVLGRVGSDAGGEKLVDVLVSEGVDIRGLIVEANYKTPIKNRVIAENQQIVRVDHEMITQAKSETEKKVAAVLDEILEGIQVIALSDYGKGFLSPAILELIFQKARVLNIPVITDPKGTDFVKYRGTTIIKPNLKEAYVASTLSSETDIDTVALKLLQITAAEYLMVTRSEEGISVFDRLGKRSDFPVRAREVKDVTGAGDTVLAMLAFALANRLPMDEAAMLCNVAAGIAIEHFGCARVSLSDLATRLLEHDATHKIFDQTHLFTLQQALKGKELITLELQDLTPETYLQIKEAKSRAPDGKILVHLKDREPPEHLVNMLASLREVDCVILNGTT
jgi:D-beta-D-heptose 7-phosphate kinase/D-beta-D-heptose 1-phosphate adenosyltransferase